MQWGFDEKFLEELVKTRKLFVVVQLLSPVRLVATPWTAACQASLTFTISRSLLRFLSVEPVMPSNHLILLCPLLFLPSIFASIRVFSNESAEAETPVLWPPDVKNKLKYISL